MFVEVFHLVASPLLVNNLVMQFLHLLPYEI